MKLPPLPAPHTYTFAEWSEIPLPLYSKDQVRAIQIAAARAALEEAAKVCKEVYGPNDWIDGDIVTSQCADAIRAIKIEGETP